MLTYLLSATGVEWWGVGTSMYGPLLSFASWVLHALDGN